MNAHDDDVQKIDHQHDQGITSLKRKAIRPNTATYDHDTRTRQSQLSEKRLVLHHLMDPAQTQRIHELFRLTEDAEGRIWFGSRYGHGFGCYDKTNFQYFGAGQERDVPTWIGGIAVDSHGGLWIGSSSIVHWNGLCHLAEDGIWVEHETNAAICAIHASGNLLYLGTNDGVTLFDLSEMQVVHQIKSLSCGLVTALLIDKTGRLWIGGGWPKLL